MIRPQAINPLAVNNNTLQQQQPHQQQHQLNLTSTHLVSTPTPTFVNLSSSSVLTTSHQTSCLSGNPANSTINSVSVSPKPPIPIDPAPRKDCHIPSALHVIKFF